MPPKGMYAAAIQKLVADKVAKALATNYATRANASGPSENTDGSGGQGRAPPTQQCSFIGYMKCNPTTFHGNEGAIKLCHWFEKTESTFRISGCAETNKVMFVAATLQGRALTCQLGRNATGRAYAIRDAKQGQGPYVVTVRLNTSYEVELADGKIVSTNTVLRGFTLNLVNHLFEIDLMPIELGAFDVIIGMDWLVEHDAMIVCGKNMRRLEDVPMICDFLEVFLDDLPGLPPPLKVEFTIELVPGAGPVTRSKEEHKEHLKIILGLLKKEQLYAKFLKYDFWLDFVKFLGHKNKKYEWGEEEEEEAFQMLKQKLCGAPILALPEETKDFVVYCDVSIKAGKITMEFVIRLPRTPSGYDSIRVIVDRLTRSAHFLPIKKTDSMEKLTRLYLNEIVFRHGVPVSIRIEIVVLHLDFGDHFKRPWDRHFPLVEFSHNNSYHASIKAAPFEALYGQKCRSPIYWSEVGDSQPTRPELIQEKMEKIVQIKNRLLPAHVRCKPLEFNIGDIVMLKVSPWKGVIRFGKRGKLSPRYIRPFKIIDRIGPLAYKLELPDEICGFHNTFYVSNLKKCLADKNLIIPLEEIQLDDKLHFIEEPVEIMDREVKIKQEKDKIGTKPDENGKRGRAQQSLKAEMAKINKNLMKVLQINQQVKAVTPSCKTCGGPHSYNDCPATVSQTQNVYAVGAYNQGGNSYQPQGNRNPLSYCLDNYLGLPGFNQNQNRNNQNQNYQNQNRNQGNNHGIPLGNNQERNQFFQRASHGQNPPPAYQAPAYQASGYQAPVHQALIPKPQVVTTTEFTNYMKANDAIPKNMQTNMTSLTNSNLKLKNMFGKFIKMNTASSSGSGTLPSNTITNLKEDLKGITTRSGNPYKGPMIPTTSSPSKVVEHESKATKETMPPTNESTKDVQPQVIQIKTPISNSEPVAPSVSEPVVAPVSAPKPNPKLSIPYPSRLHNQRLRDKANDQKEIFFKIFQDLDLNISFTDVLILMPKFGPTIKSLLTNKEKLFELAKTSLNEHCLTILLKKLPEKLGDPGKFLIRYRSVSKPISIAKDVSVKVGVFHFLADFVVVDFEPDPQVPLILRRCFLKTVRVLIDVHKGELTLRIRNEAITYNLDQTSTLKKFSVSLITASSNPTPFDDLIVYTTSPTLTSFGDSDLLLFEEADAFLGLEDDLNSPKINPFYYDPEGNILLLEAILNSEPLPPLLIMNNTCLHSRKNSSPWVSPVHCVPKKGGFTVVENEENELIPTRLVIGWRVCIHYRKLNEATRKDHFPLPFMDQMLERLAGNEYYCFLDGFSGYFQIPIDPCDQEKTTFTYPYGTYAYRRMPFGLCNAPGTFQRYMLAIFHDMVERTMEVFMDDFSVFGNSFENCLSRLDKML
nr:reverse transcriptase domain-containing protein [Tanacetum cinerariifolium]